MAVIYIDSLFLLNLILNYLLLLLSARLTGAPFGRVRLLLGAALGAAYAVLTVLPGFVWTGAVWIKIAMSLPITTLASGIKRGYLRFLALFWISSCLLAGIVLGLGLMASGTPYVHIPVRILLLTASFSYFILTLALKGIARYGGMRAKLVPVKVSYRGRQVAFNALVDTGHSLTDPFTGQSVLVADTQCLLPLLSADVRSLFNTTQAPVELVEQIQLVDGELRMRLIPFRAIGTQQGWLAAFKPDNIIIDGAENNKMLIAFSNLSTDKPYRALVNV